MSRALWEEHRARDPGGSETRSKCGAVLADGLSAVGACWVACFDVRSEDCEPLGILGRRRVAWRVVRTNAVAGSQKR